MCRQHHAATKAIVTQCWRLDRAAALDQLCGYFFFFFSFVTHSPTRQPSTVLHNYLGITRLVDETNLIAKRVTSEQGPGLLTTHAN